MTITKVLYKASTFWYLAFFLILVGRYHSYAQSSDLSDYETQFQRKANEIIDFTADLYQPPSKDIGDPEKYYWPKAIARFQKYGLEDNTSIEWLNEFAQRPPFHFTLVGMARIMGLYQKAPFMQDLNNEYLKQVFARSDGYNCWTSEGTENHNNMSRTSGYLYAQWALVNPTEFPLASKNHQLMTEWIIGYANQMFKKGNGEWNSGIYEVYNMIGWANLYDFSTEPKIKNIAKAVLDFYALEMALFYSFGTTGGPEMRGQGVGKGLNSTTAWLAYLWFGADSEKPITNKSSEPIQVIHFITSSYRPPQAIIDLAQKKENSLGLYQVSRPDYLLSKGTFVDITHFLNSDFTLGSCRSTYGGYAGSAYQMIPWKAVIKNLSNANQPFEISGNGRFFKRTDGGCRDPYTQIVQSDKALLQLTFVPSNHKKIAEQISPIFLEWEKKWRSDYEKRFPNCEKLKHKVVNEAKDQLQEAGSYLTFPKVFNFQTFNGWNYGRLGNVWIVFRQIGNGVIKISEVSNRKVVEELSQPNLLSGWVVEIIASANFQNEDVLKSKLKTLTAPLVNLKTLTVFYKGLESAEIEAQFTSSGSYTEPLVDWGYGTNQQQVFQSSPPFTQPKWPSGLGFGKFPQIIKGPKPLKEGQITIGPAVNFTNSTIDIQAAEGTPYQVDYSKDDPVFNQ